jgi:hypothetical protein
VPQPDLLGHQLADDERQVGDGEHDDAQREASAYCRDRRHPGEVARERRGQPRAAEGAGQHAHQRDPHLHRGQEARRLLRQRQGAAGPRVARFGALLQARLAGGDHGDLAHREDAVEYQECKDDQDFGGHGLGVLPGRRTAVSRDGRRDAGGSHGSLWFPGICARRGGCQPTPVIAGGCAGRAWARRAPPPARRRSSP